jgi:organic hydroperoxide reductase OsmC/OhrA
MSAGGQYPGISFGAMQGKTTKKIFFETDLGWLADTRGTLSAPDAEGALVVATPPEFGGTGKPWTPEHLFLSAISSCYMATLLAFARKLDFAISHFDCHAIGEIGMVEGRYKFIKIDLYPKITVALSAENKARQAIGKTHQHCLISNSVNTQIFYHTELMTNSPV